jgi:hypothetical protein
VENTWFLKPLLLRFSLCRYAGGLVEKYRRGFANAGATPEVTGKVLEYVQLWDKLRMCCGKRMSRSHGFTLLGRGEELSEEERAEEARTCGAVDVGHVERKLMKTEIFQKFHEKIPALGTVSAEDGAFDGTYCEEFNARFSVDTEWVYNRPEKEGGAGEGGGEDYDN